MLTLKQTKLLDFGLVGRRKLHSASLQMWIRELYRCKQKETTHEHHYYVFYQVKVCM